MSLTSWVSWAVSAVIAEQQWQPKLNNDSLSAWLPAPPLGSWPEKQSTAGGSTSGVSIHFPDLNF